MPETVTSAQTIGVTLTSPADSLTVAKSGTVTTTGTMPAVSGSGDWSIYNQDVLTTSNFYAVNLLGTTTLTNSGSIGSTRGIVLQNAYLDNLSGGTIAASNGVALVITSGTVVNRSLISDMDGTDIVIEGSSATINNYSVINNVNNQGEITAYGRRSLPTGLRQAQLSSTTRAE